MDGEYLSHLLDNQIINLLENELERKFTILKNQVKWNEFGVYFNNHNLKGIGFYSTKIT